MQYKEQIEKSLGVECLPESIWRFIESITKGETDFKKIREVVYEYLESSNLLKKYQKPTERVSFVRNTKVGDRDHAISLLLWDIASRAPDLINLRKLVLKSNLIQEETVEEWIQRQSNFDGAPS